MELLADTTPLRTPVQIYALTQNSGYVGLAGLFAFVPLPGEQLPAANAPNMTVAQFGAIVGPLLAGLMLNWIDLSTLYLIDT